MFDLLIQISKVKFDITHGSRTTLKTMEHRNPTASVDEQLNRELARLQKQAKVIATALRRDDIKGVRDMIQAVDVLFSQQKAQVSEYLNVCSFVCCSVLLVGWSSVAGVLASGTHSLWLQDSCQATSDW
jgi:hypothetical protein